jgi:multimeric flavodoxin WrbA
VRKIVKNAVSETADTDVVAGPGLIRQAPGRHSRRVPKLLIVHHTPSPNVQALFEAVVAGATTDEIEGVEVVRKPALSATVSDALDADGYLLGTPANLGMMSGALKVFFDNIYYPCLDSSRGRPYGLYVHGNDDTTGAVRGIESVTTGLGWAKSTENVLVTGAPDKADVEACWNLGATVAAGLMK